MTNDKMPDVIYALEGKSDTYDGIWDERQWSDQSGIEYHHSRIVEAMKAENEELRAKLDKLKWQPIETAPKDGSRILLAAPWIPLDNARLQTCYGHWYKIGKRWEYDGYSFGNPTSQPIKWMPLPDAPGRR